MGQVGEDFDAIRAKALRCGACKVSPCDASPALALWSGGLEDSSDLGHPPLFDHQVYIEDLKKDFVDNYIFEAVKANAIYESRYLLGTAIARPCIAKRQACFFSL